MRAVWRSATLSEVCTKITDGTHHSPQTILADPGEGRFLYLTSKNVRNVGLDLGEVGYIDRSEHNPIFSRCNPELGDILLTKDGSNTGNACLNTIKEPFSLLSSVCLLKPDTSKIHPKYLLYYLHSETGLEQIVGQMTGAAIKRIILKTIKIASIPLPPLEEQRQIVAVLDEAFAAIATATANAEKNLANARELFDALLQFELTSSGGVPTSLGAATDIKVGFAFKSSGYSTDPSDIPLIRGDNVVQGCLRWDGVKRWPRTEATSYAEYQLAADDILLAMDRTWVQAGLKYAVLSEDDIPCLLVQRVARLRANSISSSEFIALQIASPAFLEYVLAIQTGLGVPHISGKQIFDFAFSLPSPDTQAVMIKKLNAAREARDELIKTYESKLRALHKLKQSFLNKAFTGELTTTSLESIAA